MEMTMRTALTSTYLEHFAKYELYGYLFCESDDDMI